MAIQCLYDYFQEHVLGFAYFGLAVVALLGIQLCLRLWSFTKAYIFCRVLPLGVDLKATGEWAVVTGSTDGMGKAYAKDLARRGINVVLVSRSPERLREVAQEIETAYHVRTKYIAVDFSKGQEIYDKIREQLQGLDIGVLINNVGLAPLYAINFHERTDTDRIRATVDINCHSVSMMTHIILPTMVAKGKGVVINNSSATGFVPSPLVAVYSGTKAYVDFFTRALQVELKSTGVIAQVVQPFYVATKMVVLSESILVPSPAAFARAHLDQVGIQGFTNGYWTHAIQGSVMMSLPVFLQQMMIMSMLQWMNRARKALE